MTPIGYLVKSHGPFDRSGKQSSYRNAEAHPAEPSGYTGGAGIDFFFPCFGSAAFGAFGRNTAHWITSSFFLEKWSFR